MTRAILILTLMATQLLSVSSDAIYLCVRNDGSTCCVDAGPESCACCDGHDEMPDSHACQASDCAAGGLDHDHHVAADCCEDHDVPVPQSPAFAGVAVDTCDCTHIPLTMANEQPTITSRQVAAADFDFHAFLLAPVVQEREVFLLSQDFSVQHWLCEAPRIDFALTAISTIVIRC
jgi:hypothetical protein